MKRIAELRKEHRMSQTALGIKLNVSQKMISAYESGIHQPSISTLIEMSKLFNVSIDYIIENSNIRNIADKYKPGNLTSLEIELLDLFKNLSNTQQQRAIGVIYALAKTE